MATRRLSDGWLLHDYGPTAAAPPDIVGPGEDFWVELDSECVVEVTDYRPDHEKGHVFIPLAVLEELLRAHRDWRVTALGAPATTPTDPPSRGAPTKEKL